MVRTTTKEAKMATKMDLEAFEKETQDMREAIRKIANRKRPPGVAAVTTEERLHFAPARDDFEEVVPTLRDLVALTGVWLPRLEISEMDDSLKVAAILRPLLKELRDALGGLEDAVEDTIGQQRSKAYRIFVAYYSAMAPVANAEGDWQRKYDELVELFKHGKKAKADPKPKPATNADTEAPDVKTPVVDKVG
jgi:hypothetical protein